MKSRFLRAKALTFFADSGFNVENGNLESAAEEENRPIHLRPLSAPPNRQMSTVSASSADPWSTGLDLWRRDIKSSLSTHTHGKYRHFESAVTSTSEFADRHRLPPTPTSASATTRALFAPSEASDGSCAAQPSPIPAEIDVRRTRIRNVSTNLSVPEAERERILPPCSCEYPPGFTETAQ